MKSVITVMQQTAVNETGYTIRILFCTITYRPRNWTPNFENVVAPLSSSRQNAHMNATQQPKNILLSTTVELRVANAAQISLA